MCLWMVCRFRMRQLLELWQELNGRREMGPFRSRTTTPTAQTSREWVSECTRVREWKRRMKMKWKIGIFAKCICWLWTTPPPPPPPPKQYNWISMGVFPHISVVVRVIQWQMMPLARTEKKFLIQICSGYVHSGEYYCTCVVSSHKHTQALQLQKAS